MICLALVLGLAASLAGPVKSFAVVIGSNESPSALLDRLRYADDDAVQNARLAALLQATPRLLVTPDAETRDLYPDLVPTGPATLNAILDAFAATAVDVRRARAAGLRTRLYIFVAAHGDTDGGRPFLKVDDARLWAEDLAQLAKDVDAGETHVVIDACQAALMVAPRGPGGERSPLSAGFSRATPRTAWPPRTGFLTAQSAGGQTHEWADFQAGIFSHELRSGLFGAADLDLDGRVTYRELGAFIRRANQAIVNHKYRPDVLTSPPDGALDTTFADLPEGPLVLNIIGGAEGRASVDSERGVRLIDLHAKAGTAVRLRLPVDLGPLFLQQGRPPVEYRIPATPGLVSLAALSPEPPRARARGAAHEAFMRLFSMPFDASAVTSFDIAEQLERGPTIPTPPLRSFVRRASVITGALGAAGTLVLLGSGRASINEATDATSGERRAALNESLAHRQRLATITGIASVALLGIGAWLWWSDGSF